MFILLITVILWSFFPSSIDNIKMFLFIISVTVSIGIVPKIKLKEKMKISLNKYFVKKIKNKYFPNIKSGDFIVPISETASTKQGKEVQDYGSLG